MIYKSPMVVKKSKSGEFYLRDFMLVRKCWGSIDRLLQTLFKKRRIVDTGGCKQETITHDIYHAWCMTGMSARFLLFLI